MTGESLDVEAAVSLIRQWANDPKLLWEVARSAIEYELIQWRDDRMFVIRNNGFVVKEKDGSDSHVIRFGPEVGVRIALLALADHAATGGIS